MNELSLNSLELVPRERLRDLKLVTGVGVVGLTGAADPKTAEGEGKASSFSVPMMRLSCRLEDLRSQGLVDGSAFKISRSGIDYKSFKISFCEKNNDWPTPASF